MCAASIMAPLLGDYVDDRDERMNYPENTLEAVLLSETFQVAKEFFALLHEPIVRLAITEFFLHTRIQSATHTHNSSEQHALYVFEALCGEPLKFEIVSYVGGDKMLYFFGTRFASLGFPMSVLSKCPEISSRILRLCACAQVNDGGVLTNASHDGPGSRSGSAFKNVNADRRSNRVTYTNFAFDATLDSAFPRRTLLSCYVLSFLSHARKADRDYNHTEKLDSLRSCSASPVHRDAQEAAREFLRRSSTGESLADLGHSMSNSPPPPPPTMYENSATLLRSALKNALQLSDTPCVPRRRLRVSVGTKSRGSVRVVETAPVEDESMRRLEMMREECAPLMQLLKDCHDGELKGFLKETVLAANRGVERIINCTF